MAKDDHDADITMYVMDDYTEMTRELMALTIPNEIANGEKVMLVTGIHEGISPGPIVENMNTAAVIAEGWGRVGDELEYPAVVLKPKEIAEFTDGAILGAEKEGEQGKPNTVVFWLVPLKNSGRVDTGAQVKRWTYRAIGRPDARITYTAHAHLTRDLREAFKVHAQRLRDVK